MDLVVYRYFQLNQFLTWRSLPFLGEFLVGILSSQMVGMVALLAIFYAPLSIIAALLWSATIKYIHSDATTNVHHALTEWIIEDDNQILMKYCCIWHFQCLKNHQPHLKYFENNIQRNRNYYAQITWNELKNNLSQYSEFRCGFLWSKIKYRILSAWNWFASDLSSFTYFRLRYGLFAMYIFIVIVSVGLIIIGQFLWCAYFGPLNLLCVIISYLFVEIVEFEFILLDFSHLTMDWKTLIEMKRYYNFIKHDCHKLEPVLIDIYGSDIAGIVLDFLPDHKFIYKICAF